MFALLPMRSLFLTMFLSFDDDDDEKEDIFCKNNRWKKVNTERVKKSFRLPFFIIHFLFVFCFDTHHFFLSTLAFYSELKRERIGTFL